ncbi:MAG: hypothetical protein Q8Q06_03640 [bacterium]|nr:hypothetical protein [bacterium]
MKVSLYRLVRSFLCLVVGFLIWVGSAQFGSFIFRGTESENMMIVVGVLGMFAGIGFCFKFWPKSVVRT